MSPRRPPRWPSSSASRSGMAAGGSSLGRWWATDGARTATTAATSDRCRSGSCGACIVRSGLGPDTEDGSYVAVRQKEKTIRFKGEEVEVRRLTPEEKARKRFVKNVVMGLFGIAVLAAVAIILMMVT